MTQAVQEPTPETPRERFARLVAGGAGRTEAANDVARHFGLPLVKTPWRLAELEGLIFFKWAHDHGLYAG